MKNIKTYVILLAWVLLMVQCKSDDDPGLTAQQQAAQTLGVTWGEAQVLSSPVDGSLNGLDALTLTFEVNQEFQPVAFGASGAPDYFQVQTNSTWAWADATTTHAVQLINVTPVQALSIVSLSATSLTVSFMYQGPTGGRGEGIGEYQVQLERQ